MSHIFDKFAPTYRAGKSLCDWTLGNTPAGTWIQCKLYLYSHQGNAMFSRAAYPSADRSAVEICLD